MKSAVLLHGTGGSPEGNWFPWLKKQLEDGGYEVWAPALPGNETPNRQTYNDFLFSSGWDFTDNIVIGHSSGAVSVLNLLLDKRCPHIKLGVPVGAWAHMRDSDLESPDRFEALFPPDGFDFGRLKQQVDELVYIHGDNDALCPIDQARWLAEQTDSEFIVVPGGGHFRGSEGFMELPEIVQVLKKRNLL